MNSKLSETAVFDSDGKSVTTISKLPDFLSSVLTLFQGCPLQSLLPVYILMLPTLLAHCGDIYVQLQNFLNADPETEMQEEILNMKDVWRTAGE